MNIERGNSCHKIMMLAVMAIFAFGNGCLRSSSSGASTTGGTSSSSSGGTTSTTTTSSSTCTTSIVDSGQKGTAAGTIRGIYADTRMIPGGTYYATAYIDQSAYVIKLSYWNGSSYSIETVSGDGAGTFVRLAFNSSGIPFVFWANGTRVRAASRSAALTTAGGTWTSATIDTGTAPRAIEVAVSPLDDIGVSFLTDTAAGGRHKVIFCPATCSSVTGFITMTPNAYTENSNLTAASTSTGIAWCKASASQYYPAIVYPGTAAVRYGVCQNTLANCLSSTNWSFGNVAAVSVVGANLYLDPTVTGDVPKVIARNATGVAPYLMNASTACTAAVAAFTAGANIGGSGTVGTLWMQLGKTSDGKFHLAANNSTTNVYYYNSSTTTFNGAWNGPGTVETTTLLSGGGAAIDSTNNIMHIGYGMNAANYDMKVANVNDTTVAAASATFSRYVVDSTGMMMMASASNQRRTIDMAATSSGMPAVVYVDYSIAGTANAKLKYALRGGSSSSSTWIPYLIPLTGSPQYPDLAFDENNKPWISYFDAGNNKFYLVTNSATDGSGSWTTYEHPATPSGAPAAFPAANNTSIAMHYSSGIASPVMVVTDNNATSRGLKVAKFTKSTQSWSAVTTIDALGASGAANVSSDYDTSGNIIVGYYEMTTAQRARYAYSTNGTTWSTPLTIAPANGQGMGLSARINPSTSKPAMAYYDRANNTVKLSTCSGTIATCASSGWSTVDVDTVAGVSGLTTTSDQLLSTGFRYRSDGTIELWYVRGAGNDASLIRATSSDGVTFTSSVLLAGPSSSFTGIAALNYGVAGWNVDIIRNGAGSMTGVYIGPGNYLYTTSCGD